MQDTVEIDPLQTATGKLSSIWKLDAGPLAISRVLQKGIGWSVQVRDHASSRRRPDAR